MVKPRWTDVKEVLPPAPGGKWSLSIEVPEQPAKNGRPIAIPSKTDFFERMRALVISPVCRRAAIGYTSDRAALRTPSGRSAGGGLPDREGQTRIVLCDLESGQVLSTGTASGKSVPLALSDSGEQLLMRREDTGFGRSEVLETWRVTNSGITKELQFSPHDDTKGGADKIQWARYVDKERFVTAGTAGFLVVWNAAAKPLYWLKIDAQGRPALSPDRKYVVFATGKQIGVLDVTSGTVVAMQEFQQHLGAPVFAFTPGGTRLVCGTHDRVLVWDVATGALYREIPLAGARVQVGENLLCPSEDHLLAGNSVLVDIDSQAKLWTYRGPEAGAMLGGVCWFLVSPHDAAGALVPTVLPHPAAQEQIQKAMQSADFFVVKPGSSVKVNVSALADPAERERAGAALTKKLEANGCQVGPNGSIELVASVETGQRRQLSYGSHGPFFRGGSVSYSFQEYASRLKFVSQGQTLWEIAGTNNPGFMIHLKQGETIEQYLKAREHPNYDFFSSVEIPKMVQKSSQGGNTIGTSQVTVAGIQ